MDELARSRSSFGSLLKHWRAIRGDSQLALALRVGTTTRHLSYLENGRSRAGRDMVLRLAEALDMPLRVRNDFLAAAGLPLEFPASAITSPPLAPYRRAVLRLIETMHPFPAFVLDPLFTIEDMNAVGRKLLPVDLTRTPVNLVEMFVAPGAARALIANFAEVAWSLHARFLRTTATLPRAMVQPIRERIEEHLRDVPRPTAGAAGDPVICPTLLVDGVTVHTIGMTMRFGPSRDVTLEELSVDVLCPRDAEAALFFQELGRT
jgi:transcriptional regulator with XRE-family HTH domain